MWYLDFYISTYTHVGVYTMEVDAELSRDTGQSRERTLVRKKVGGDYAEHTSHACMKISLCNTVLCTMNIYSDKVLVFHQAVK